MSSGLKDAPLLSIILPSLRSVQLAQCLDSIKHYTQGIAYEVIVISPLDFGPQPDVVFIKESKAEGIYNAVAAGYERARGEYIIHIPDDVRATPLWAASMISFMRPHDNEIFEGNFRHFGATGERPEPGYYGKLFAPFLCVRRDKVERIGGLMDRAYYSFFGDADLSLRVWHQGGRVATAPDAWIYHADCSDDVHQTSSNSYFSRDREVFILRWHTIFARPDDTMDFYASTPIARPTVPPKLPPEQSVKLYVSLKRRDWKTVKNVLASTDRDAAIYPESLPALHDLIVEMRRQPRTRQQTLDSVMEWVRARGYAPSQASTVAATNGKNVAVFLKDSSEEAAVQEYARANGLKILYTFKPRSETAATPEPLVKQGIRELTAVIKRKRGAKGLLTGVIRQLAKSAGRSLRREPAFYNRALMTMIEYVTHYQQCQGLLVFDVKDISPDDLPVVRWVIDKVHRVNKETYSVTPFDYESLPRYEDKLETDFERKWQQVVSACDFQYRQCPPIISITVFEKECFLKCRFCYQVKNPGSIKEDYLDFDVFKKIIADIPGDTPVKIVLGPGGEPMTYPKMHEMVRYVSDTRPLAVTEYSTNGVLVDEANARRIIESGLKRIEFSLNAPSREDYQWFTGFDGYDKVIGNMIGLMKLRSELSSTTPVVVTKIMGMKRWADKIEGSIRYLNSIIDNARVSPVSYYQDAELENIDPLKPSTNPLLPECMYLSSNMIIMPNGRYQLCCAPDFAGEKYGPVDLGNARDKGPFEVWGGEKYAELRRINAQGRPIYASCLSCNINRPDFESDLIVKAKQRKLLGLDR
ncbi:MAG: radical SAM protein [Dehalococcoidales bacterium]|nr:radical SAM protein [Dehalococcoidales bacterium]